MEGGDFFFIYFFLSGMFLVEDKSRPHVLNMKRCFFFIDHLTLQHQDVSKRKYLTPFSFFSILTQRVDNDWKKM